MLGTDTKIKIWAVFKNYFPDFSGAAVQGNQNLMLLSSQGYSVTVLTEGSHKAHVFRGKKIERDGIQIRYMRVMSYLKRKSTTKNSFLVKLVGYFNGLLNRLLFDWQVAFAFLREGHRNDIAQFYFHDEFSFFPMWVARTRGMHPVVTMTMFGSDDPSSLKRRHRIDGAMKLQSFYQSEAVIAISSALKNSCDTIAIDQSKVVKIPNGVDLNIFYPITVSERSDIKQELGLKIDKKYIVFVGAAQYRKGIDVLIKAFIKVAQRISDVELLIVGPNDFNDLTRYLPDRQLLVSSLMCELENAGCLSRVCLVGEVEINKVKKYLQAADIFCLPTRKEGFGIVIIEAMAVGLPVVVAHLDGITTDIIASGDDGILIDGYDPDNYADALLLLLQEHERARAMGNNAKERIVREFSLDSVVQQYIKLYQSLRKAGD